MAEEMNKKKSLTISQTFSSSEPPQTRLTDKSTMHSPVFSIGLKNIGPIESGDIEIKPCTIIIGSNRSGKSYIAKTIYAFYSLQNDLYYSTSPLPHNFKSPLRDELPVPQELYELLRKWDTKTDLILPDSTLSTINSSLFAYISENLFSSVIQDVFNTQLKDLKSKQTKEGEFTYIIKGQKISITLEKNALHLRNVPDSLPLINYKISYRKEDGVIDISYHNFHFVHPISHLKEKTGFENIARDVTYCIAAGLIQEFYFYSAFDGVYFPAGRASLMEMKPFVSIQLLSSSRISAKSSPKMSSVFSDFFALLEKISTTKDISNDQYDDLIYQLIGGRFEIKKISDSSHEYQYYTEKSPIPFHLLSSGVQELAPILLYIKYRMQAGDLIIIEEPEAHLHPANQLIMAQLITKMIREKVTVILTTHSDYLVEQLANHLKAGLLSPEERKALVSDSDYYIKSDEIAVYLMEKSEKINLYHARSIPIDPAKGIPSEEFVKVSELLYNETIQIEQEIEAE
ncbi:MAG: ATP-binding protein [Methanomicrobiales archaeon]|nr:ATP-binding protein [Methanomicrobiales archaeon]